ncbi:hypothetical protein CAPTEDRAFT_185530 [Capitella teleta]|uniref:SWIM-type domain-containing protein n=1 Tax=Capitella teleta TaxID=283909 RepID=R7TRM8_CAPTE|nr:hypothetical protein CAPTEDRAFT_185530 [Capitella teleta]|eukprot:ELT96289.1 hypothetical protein CAPTEDRAFT_185530 [Capitella teleta]
MDRHNCRVFLLLTHCCAGEIPVGCLVTTSESTEVISAALELYKSLLDDKSFYGRGREGPQVFMTDESSVERSALASAFPNSTLILCAFHVLQAFWRFLFEAKNRVARDHRKGIFGRVKLMLFANEEAELVRLYQESLADPDVQRYPSVKNHLCEVYDKRHDWALCFRHQLPVRGNATNNYCEAAMGIIKDISWWPFSTRLEQYYERRLTDLANNRFDAVMQSRYLPKLSTIEAEHINHVEGDTYEVVSQRDQNKSYSVDMAVGLCSCHVGSTGGPCKHQYAILCKHKLTSWNFVPINSPSMRQFLYQLAVGPNNMPAEWFRSLHVDREAERHLPLQQSQEVASQHPINAAVDAMETCEPDENRRTDEAIAGVLSTFASHIQDLQDKVKTDPEHDDLDLGSWSDDLIVCPIARILRFSCV